MSLTIDQLPGTRRQILLALKRDGSATIAELARSLGLTGEAVRQQLLQLQRESWVESRIQRDPANPRSGRPATRYRLTPTGDHLFPKQYDRLATAVLDAVAAGLGDAALEKVLAHLADSRVDAWSDAVKGLPLRGRLEVIRQIYAQNDAFAEIIDDEQGLRLVERNCPFMNAAMRRPAVCSITVNALTRLLGVGVLREERIQDGHGRCVFRIFADQPVDPDRLPFLLERPLEPTV